jgi:membrane glycosyltransferase
VPIVGPLLLAAPIVVWTSRRSTGDAMAKKGFLVTPAGDEQSATPSVLHGPVRPNPMTDGAKVRALRALQSA